MALRFKQQGYYYGRVKRRIRLLRMAMVGLALLIVAVIVFAIILWNRHGENSSPDTSGQVHTINYQPFKTFTTDYFTFQTDKNWQAVPAEATPQKYVYRAYKNGLAERDLTVYINQLPPRLMLTYIVPVQPAGDRLQADEVSQHCRTSLPADYLAQSNNPRQTTMSSVGFLCWTDSSSITIGTGVKGGSYQAGLSHASTQAQYFLLYHDVAYTPKPEIFRSIVTSFRSR